MRASQTRTIFLSGLVGFVMGVSFSSLFGMQQLCTAGNGAGEYRESLEQRDVGDTRCVSREQLSYLTKLAQSAIDGVSNASRMTLPSWRAQLAGRRGGAPPGSDIQALREFLYPKDQIRLRRKGTPIGEPKLLKEEYNFKQNLFMGVMTSEKYLPTRARVVYETWGQEVDKVVFFVGEDCSIPPAASHLPVVKLSGIPDNVYPPLKKAFAVMQYMHDNFADGYNWFVRADDDMYVRGKKLSKLLQSMNHNEKIYLGRAGTGRSEDLKRLNLMPYERYCMGGPGVIFSAAAIRGVGPHLSTCLQAITFHDQHMRDDQEWNDDDVEIGRCVSRKLDIQCSTSAESRYFFQFDYNGDILNAMTLWTKPEYQDLISVHPVKSPENMRAIHHFFATLEFETLHDELYNMSRALNRLCKSLPPHLLPPPLAAAGSCDLSVFSCKNCHDSWTGPKGLGSYLVKKDHIPYFHNPMDRREMLNWNSFNSDFFQELSSLTPQHDLYPTFRAELQHMIGLVEAYVSSIHQTPLSVTNIDDGYVRYNRRAGPEYIMTLKFNNRNAKGRSFFHRVRLTRPLQPAIYVIDEPLPDEKSMVSVILPLKAVDDHLRQFVIMFVDIAQKEPLHLIVVAFGQSDANAAQLAISQEVEKGHSSPWVTVVVSLGAFNWTTAVESGMSVLKNADDLAFVADINLRIKPQFWDKCRANTLRGKRVYFPTVFQTYQTDYRYTSSSSAAISYWNGHWAVYSLKTLCIYKSDYDAIGGYVHSRDPKDLFDRVIKHNIEVFQAPDASLYRVWDSTRAYCSDQYQGGTTHSAFICQSMKRLASLEQSDILEYLADLTSMKHKPFDFAASRRSELSE